jgi:hypothetical protein
MHKNGDDQLLIDDVCDDENFENGTKSIRNCFVNLDPTIK